MKFWQIPPTTFEQATAGFDLVTCAALMLPASQSVLTNRDEDMTDLGHEASVPKKKKKKKVMITNQF